jgi:hypothetical protein
MSIEKNVRWDPVTAYTYSPRGMRDRGRRPVTETTGDRRT